MMVWFPLLRHIFADAIFVVELYQLVWVDRDERKGRDGRLDRRVR